MPEATSTQSQGTSTQGTPTQRIPRQGVPAEGSPVQSAPAQPGTPRLTLNTDGQPHPALNAATAFTFFGGLAAFALGLVSQAHLAATVLGIVAFGLGMATQMMSETREQRIFIVAGIIAAGVGTGVGLAHGGFG